MGEHLCLEQAWRNTGNFHPFSQTAQSTKHSRPFPILAVMLLQGAAVGVFSWVRAEPRSWAQHLGEFLSSASPEANCACMWRGEGKETESKLLTAESPA